MIPTFVISMEKDNERRESCIGSAKEIGLEPKWIHATVGKSLFENEQKKLLEGKEGLISLNDEVVLSLPFGRKVVVEDTLSAAEMGCAHSHLRVYEIMVKENISEALILEDDALLLSPCKDVLPLIMRHRSKWDIVQLYHESGLRDLIYRRRIYLDSEKKFYIKREGMGVLDPIFNRRRFSIYACAYLINQNAAKKLIELGYPIRLPADYLTGLVSYNKLRLYTCHPKEQLVKLDEFKSTIGNFGETRPKHRFR